MAETIERFPVSEKGFSLPVRDVLTGRGFVTGKSGSGKSNTASVIVEELLDRNLPLLIVDTDGEYVGLQETYDLLHVGGSDSCDLQLSSEDADRLTTHALEDRIPILLDLSTYADEEEFEAVLYETVDALFDAEQEYRIPFLILLEEAHEFIPQQGGSDLKTLLIRVAKRGRKRGLGFCSLSQRPAAVDKEFITQCNWFVWHRLTWENDTAVVGRILGNDSAETVQSLNDGEAIVQTDWNETTDRVQFRRRHTEDAGSTPSLDDLDLSPGGGSGRTRTATETSGSSTGSEIGDSEPPAAEAEPTNGGATARSSTEAPDRGEPTTTSPEMTGEATEETGRRTRQLPAGTTEVSYDESTVTASSATAIGSKPSLERRRERRETPTDTADPLWEIGAIVVYLYDTLVWYHLLAVSRLEWRVAAAVDQIHDALVGRRLPRRPGTFERRAYRLLAVLGVMASYALVVLAVMIAAGAV